MNNTEDRSGAKSPLLPRSRRLSLEGPRTIKKESLQPKASAVGDLSKTLQYEAMSISQQKNGQQQDPEAVSKLNGQLSNVISKAPPRSPTKINYQKRLIKVDSGVQIHPIKLPQTPEPSSSVVDNNNNGFGNDSITTKAKGSQLRRSLRTIGKLINGPDKRCVFLTSNLFFTLMV